MINPMKKVIVSSMLLLLCYSCNKEVESIAEGTWNSSTTENKQSLYIKENDITWTIFEDGKIDKPKERHKGVILRFKKTNLFNVHLKKLEVLHDSGGKSKDTSELGIIKILANDELELMIHNGKVKFKKDLL